LAKTLWDFAYLCWANPYEEKPATGNAGNSFLELMTSNDELAQVLQDIHTLCDQGEFKPEVFVDFIGQGSKRQFMQYHRDYHQKLAPKRQ